ncbi:glycosyltransferase [Aliarcobacter cryaerophilus]|uniref:glycosyltransferase n=1 Tax=Aliarcobacter cryaerophilus TaxID=28198 RepID=UPI0011E04FAB|nr:glycosyltransferase [Aliarcobacter cryaerophilus]
MNILIISPLQTYPTDHGSKKRILELGMYFKKLGHRVHLVYLKHRYEYLSEFTIDKMLEQWDTLTVVHIEKCWEEKLLYYPLDYLYEDHIGIEVLELTKNLDIHMVLVNYIYYSKILEILPNNIIKVLDTIDKFTDRNIMLENAKVDRSHWWFSIKKEDEALGLNRADLVLAIQKDEKEFFESICNKEVVLINHLEYENFIKPLHHKDKLIIGFIGSNNGSNISSINSFIDKFINLINISGLNIELQIAGKVCDHIKEQHKNIKKLYFLEDTTDFFKNIHLFVNPLTSGTGLKIKSVEALSYGVPIISTKVGFEGIESSSKFHKIDNLDLMIEYIKEIIQNPSTLNELSNISKNIFEEYTKKLDKNISTIFNYDNDNTSKKNLSNDFIKNYNTVQKYKIKYEILNYKYEINQNRTFSIWINKIYSQLDSFIAKNNKFILYGFGHIGKIIYNRYKDNILFILDKNYEKMSEEENIKISSVDTVKLFKDELIVIAVLGREDEISKYLIKNFDIDINRIININLKENN